MSAWTDVRDTLVKVGLPLLGNAVLPGSGTVVSLITGALGMKESTPDALIAAISNPENLLKLKELQYKHEEFLAQISYDADKTVIQAVNTTMQDEAKSESWLQRSWRPINGILFAPTILMVYVILPIIKVPTPSIDPTVWLMWGSVLGITAWHRGVKQVEEVKKNGNGK